MAETTTTTAPTTALGGAAADAAKGAAGGETKVDAKAGETKVVDSKSPEGKAAIEAALATEKATKEAAEAASKPFADVAQLKLPEGAKLDDAQVKSFLEVAKAEGFTAKQAQALVEYNLKQGAAAAKAQVEARDAAAKTMGETLKNDKDIGGPKFEASMGLARKALAYIGSPELNEALQSARLEDGTMLGDQPWFAKILVNLGGKVSEDTTKGANGNGATVPAAEPGALARGLYTHPTSKSHLKFEG